MPNKLTVILVAALVLVCCQVASAQLPNPLAKSPSPDLTGQLAKQLSVTPEQAIGGAGAIFGAAKTKLSPADFLKVSNAVPGMDGLLKAAPKPKAEGSDMFGAMSSVLPGKAGGLAAVAGSFKQLGMSPQMAAKFLPVMTQFVKVKGGAEVAGLLSGAFK
jgi:uncharacterized protein VcgC/VcgE DUF2780